MDKAKLIEKLNQAIGVELAGLLQYNQYAQVLMGQERKIWQDFFKDASDEALDHARRFAARVTALGGTPNAEPEAIKQTQDVHQMLLNSLELERRALETYIQALELCADHAGYRNLLEDQIQAETEDVEELEKYLNQVQKVAAGTGGAEKRGRKSA